MWSPMGPHFLGWIIKNGMYVKLGRYVLLDLIMGTTLGRQATFYSFGCLFGYHCNSRPISGV